MTRTPLLLVAAFLAACSSSSSSPSGGSGDGGGASSSSSGGGGDPNGTRVTLTASLSAGSHATDCKQTSELDVGAFPDTPVAHKEMWNGGTAIVVCRVTPAGAGFTVASSVSLSGGANGSFEIGGTFDATGATQVGIQTVFGGGGSYAGKTCTAKFMNPSEGVAAGRVWTEFDCADASDNASGSTCDLSGQVRFENCIQQ